MKTAQLVAVQVGGHDQIGVVVRVVQDPGGGIIVDAQGIGDTRHIAGADQSPAIGRPPATTPNQIDLIDHVAISDRCHEVPVWGAGHHGDVEHLIDCRGVIGVVVGPVQLPGIEDGAGGIHLDHVVIRLGTTISLVIGHEKGIGRRIVGGTGAVIDGRGPSCVEVGQHEATDQRVRRGPLHVVHRAVLMGVAQHVAARVIDQAEGTAAPCVAEGLDHVSRRLVGAVRHHRPRERRRGRPVRAVAGQQGQRQQQETCKNPPTELFHPRLQSRPEKPSPFQRPDISDGNRCWVFNLVESRRWKTHRKARPIIGPILKPIKPKEATRRVCWQKGSRVWAAGGPAHRHGRAARWSGCRRR